MRLPTTQIHFTCDISHAIAMFIVRSEPLKMEQSIRNQVYLFIEEFMFSAISAPYAETRGALWSSACTTATIAMHNHRVRN